MALSRRAWVTGMLAAPALVRKARAEVGAIRLGKQFGLPFMPQLVMESQRLIERHAEAAGLPGLVVDWTSMSGPGALNEALLSGNMQFVNVATPALATLWERTYRTQRPIKALCTVQSMPHVLMTRSPAVHSIADLGPDDRIAVPTAKISSQAMSLQMAAARLWGISSFDRLDRLTVSLGHPDAMIAMLSGKSEITGHFCVAPFQQYERAAGMRPILKSYDTMGGPHTNGIQVTSEAFYTANPIICRAVFDAHTAANAFINRNPRAAAEIYRSLTHDTRGTVDDLAAMIADPDIVYTTAPANLMTMLRFMSETGRLKSMPASWKDLFLPPAHSLEGS